MFGLVKQTQGGVAGAVCTHRHQVLQVLEAASQVSPAVLFQLVMSWPIEREKYVEKYSSEFIGEKYQTQGVAYKWCSGKESGTHTWLQSWASYERQVFRLYQQLRVVGRMWTLLLEYFMRLYVCFDLNLVPLLPDFRAPWGAVIMSYQTQTPTTRSRLNYNQKSHFI